MEHKQNKIAGMVYTPELIEIPFVNDKVHHCQSDNNSRKVQLISPKSG